jgi:hypothetical protein
MTLKLGRLPRGNDPRIPMLSALRPAVPALATPTAPDWLSQITDLNSFGMMLNDKYGCCVVAGSYHGIQILSSVMNPDGLEITEPDACVLKAYELVTGFNPTDPATDQGTDMQTYLKYWMTTGIPTGPAAATRHRCVGFAEVDIKDHAEVLEVIQQCGFIYLGFNVPNYIMGQDELAPLGTWDYPPAPGADATLSGGHCVIAPKADAEALYVVSWGAVYKMTWAFWDQFVDEAYAVIDLDWGNAKGTPYGISLEALAKQMEALAA